MPGIVIENPALSEGANRAVVDSAALYEMVLRGWVAVGPAAQNAEGLLTEQEWADELARRDAEVEAALAGTVTTSSTTEQK
jgi:hypothetical protein